MLKPQNLNEQPEMNIRPGKVSWPVDIIVQFDAAERALRADMGIFGLFVEAKDDNSQIW